MMKLLVEMRGEDLEENIEEELVWVVKAKFLTTDQKLAIKFARSLEMLGFQVKTNCLIRECEY